MGTINPTVHSSFYPPSPTTDKKTEVTEKQVMEGVKRYSDGREIKATISSAGNYPRVGKMALAFIGFELCSPKQKYLIIKKISFMQKNSKPPISRMKCSKWEPPLHERL